MTTRRNQAIAKMWKYSWRNAILLYLVVKYQNFESWEELRDLLKSNLEPQRTTQHLYQSLYATKQKTGMDILTYSKEIEALQNTIIEQETIGCTIEVAQALERTIKRQALQVFIEGLGDLKNYIKARHPDSLFNAIQAAREEEIVRKSSEESKKLYKPAATSKTQPGMIIFWFGFHTRSPSMGLQ
ncbi:uncharacterized protein LOC111028125 [Myzus persicae]|uniref:uncharacterized protein LOC111028125 n=1 Tax=Myzus persicae TaxID=13164 RepID=UPI000B9332ED|nr:uncharacterized protein LOC111028125 [Myzus persicae]